ncbi:MAG: sugar kinase, partial [Candidatus Nitrosopolaris sp.]
SFAGGFIGYIAKQNNLTFDTMKEAVVYGNVMGAFAVEDFGIRKLLSLTIDDVENRYREHRNLIQF